MTTPFTEGATLEAFHLKGLSAYEYRYPVQLEQMQFLSSSAHIGRYMHAIDIAVPNPKVQPTVVYAPISGMITSLDLSHNTWGPTPDFASQGNYITILAADGVAGEFVELVHVAVDPKLKSEVVKAGMRVKAGDKMGVIVGMNGFIEAPNGKPDPHLHVMVGRWLPNSPDAFRSLEIRWLKDK